MIAAQEKIRRKFSTSRSHYPMIRVKHRKHGSHPTLAELLSTVVKDKKKKKNRKGQADPETEKAKNDSPV